jgi:predicted ArsR family transcriptional regulator
MMPRKSDAEMSARRRGSKKPEVFRIEGLSVTCAEIAARLGVTTTTVRRRMQQLRNASGAVTFERLRAIGS